MWQFVGRRCLFLVSSTRQCFFATIAAKSKGNLNRKVNLNVGTIGHIDHGKTTLTAAITRMLSEKGLARFTRFEEIDKGKEEKRRGITINIAHIGYETEKRRYAHTDCPGHSDFIKNMICGTAQMDAAVLVIAANDGVMAQTREHLLLARQLGVSHIVVFINKADLVDETVLELVELEAKELLSQIGFDENQTIAIRGSALAALEHGDYGSIKALLDALDAIPEPCRMDQTFVVMPIASRISITGRGTVVVGTVEQGTLKKGDKIEIAGDGTSLLSTVADVQVKAGEHCGVLCRGLKADAVHRGMWLGTPGTIQCSNLLRVEMYLLSEAESGRHTAIRNGVRDRVFCTTWDKVGVFRFDNDMIMPGEHGSGVVAFLRPMPVAKGIPFTLRNDVDSMTVARGVVSEILPSFPVDSLTDWRPLLKTLENVSKEKKREENVSKEKTS